MKNNNRCRFLRLFTAVFLSSVTTSTNAALYTRLEGMAVYDSDFNITWTANANINGVMTWDEARTWASNLVIGGVSGWRLPATLQPDTSCSEQWFSAAWIGIGEQGAGYNCTGSEMGHLFYNELGGVAGTGIDLVHNAKYSLFSNFTGGSYWSGTTYAPDGSSAWNFIFGQGKQQSSFKGGALYAMAVRDGDVASVPIPAAFWLFGSGLLGLIGLARKKAA